MAIVDDITIMGSLAAVVEVESARSELQKPANYLVNPAKQHVYTANEAHVEQIQIALPEHKVIYVGHQEGFSLSGIPLGGEVYIREKMQTNLTQTKEVIKQILTLNNTQEKLILLCQCIPGRIQHLLAATPMEVSRTFAQQHDEALYTAMATVLDLGELNQRDKLLMQRKISNHGLGLRSMEKNLEFLFLAGFMRSAKSIQQAFPNFSHILEHTLNAESGYGRQLADALEHLQTLGDQRLRNLLPDTLHSVLSENFEWPHDEIQRQLDRLLADEHDALFNLNRVMDQQDKANMLATDTLIFQLIPRNELLRIPNDQLIYLAKQLFGKPQRKYAHKFCPNTGRSIGSYCGAALDSRDIHLRTCKMNNVNHQKHAAVQHWFQELAKAAHIKTSPAPPISEASNRHPTKQPAGDLMLHDFSMRGIDKDGICGVVDFSIVTPAAEAYCARAAKEPLFAATLREEHKISLYAQAYKATDNIHFEPFVLESGGVFGQKTSEVFKKICNLITRTTGQSGSAIAYFWKSRLLVVLAAITHSNALKWALAHNKAGDPDSITQDMTDFYDDDTAEIRRSIHSSGPARKYAQSAQETEPSEGNDEAEADESDNN
jgi:hypothetical protein